MEYETRNKIIDIYQKHNKSKEINEDLFNALIDMYKLAYDTGEQDCRQRFYVNEFSELGREQLLQDCHENNKFIEEE